MFRRKTKDEEVRNKGRTRGVKEQLPSPCSRRERIFKVLQPPTCQKSSKFLVDRTRKHLQDLLQISKSTKHLQGPCRSS